MKIEVRDEKGKTLGAIRIKVLDLDQAAAVKKLPFWHKALEKILLGFVQKRQSGNGKKSADNATKTIEIRISLPSFANLSAANILKSLKNSSRKTKRILASAFLLLAVLIVFLIFSPHKKNTATAVSKVKLPPLVHANPPYATLLPAGKTVQQLGGWVKISRPNGQAAYVYYDTLDNSPIRVSEQPLPQSFDADPDGSVAQLAQNSNANEKFSANGTTIYVENTSDQQQFVIFSKNGLLVLINSGSEVSANDWVKYVTSLN